MKLPLPLYFTIFFSFIRDIHASTTHHLLYDGILSNSMVEVNGVDGKNIPQTLEENVSSKISVSILSSWEDSLKEGSIGKILEDIQCFTDKYGKNGLKGSKCVGRYSGDDLTVDTMTTFYHTAGDDGKNVIGTRIDATITTEENELSRIVLISSLPKISDLLSPAMTSTWSIHERPSLTSKINENEGRLIEDKKTSSHIDTVLLSNTIFFSKQILAIDSSASIWQYQEDYSSRPTKALFISSRLRYLTNIAGTAYAEAFIHPALISHSEPLRIAVISATPLALVKEILKYRSVIAVHVVGADKNAMEMARTYIPELDDCSYFLGLNGKSCLEDERIYVVDESVNEWIEMYYEVEIKERYSDEFDVIFLDINDDRCDKEKSWFSSSFQKELSNILSDDGILIVGGESLPSMDREYEKFGSPCSIRDDFLRQVTRQPKYGGLGYSIATVYDEPMASPLSTSFIIVFPEYNDAHARFLRKKVAAIDLDLAAKLHPSASSTPTLFYDGLAQSRYILPPRPWEHWYCHTYPGNTLPICTSFLSNYFNPDYHHYQTEVRNDPVKGRSLFAMEEIPKGHFVLPHDVFLNILIDIEEWEALEQFVEDFPSAELYRNFRDLVLAYGYEVYNIGNTGWGCSLACNNTFTNHACTKEDATVEPLEDLFINEDGEEDSIGFSPPLSRRAAIAGILARTSKNVKKGEELMIDYGTFRNKEGHPGFHDSFLGKNVCEEHVGMIPVDSNEEEEDNDDRKVEDDDDDEEEEEQEDDNDDEDDDEDEDDDCNDEKDEL